MMLKWFVLFLIGSPLVAGTVTGKVVYKGKVPGVLKKPIKLNEECRGAQHGEVFPEFLVLGQDGTSVQNVIVYVKSGLPKGKYKKRNEEVIIDQKGCRYVPHVVAVQVGQKLTILNDDGKNHSIMHNVNGKPKSNGVFNLSMTKSKVKIDKVFKKAEKTPFPLMCNVHPWMKAWVGVFDHPFFSVTQENGQYEIKNLPKGTYEIEVWHEKLEPVTQTIEVTSNDQTVELQFELKKLKKKGRKKRKKKKK